MSSLFDTAVYNRKNHTPWTGINLLEFARDMAVQGSDVDDVLAQSEGIQRRNYHSGKNDFLLIVQYRNEVSSRFWFTAKWTGADGKRHQAEAQTIELCMWRAAQIELDIQKAIDSKGGNDE